MSDFLRDLDNRRRPPRAPAPTEDSLPIVAWFPVRCGCGATKPRTTGRNGRRRYHTCARCGQRFLSHEIADLDELVAWLRQTRGDGDGDGDAAG